MARIGVAVARFARRRRGAGNGRADAPAWTAASAGDEFGRNPIA